jgi:hypothetical protein
MGKLGSSPLVGLARTGAVFMGVLASDEATEPPVSSSDTCEGARSAAMSMHSFFQFNGCPSARRFSMKKVVCANRAIVQSVVVREEDSKQKGFCQPRWVMGSAEKGHRSTARICVRKESNLMHQQTSNKSQHTFQFLCVEANIE